MSQKQELVKRCQNCNEAEATREMLVVPATHFCRTCADRLQAAAARQGHLVAHVPLAPEEAETALAWRQSLHLSAVVEHDGRRLTITMATDPKDASRWGAMAIETAAAEAIDINTANSHSHKAIGTYSGQESAKRAAEGFADSWVKRHKVAALAGCDCEELRPVNEAETSAENAELRTGLERVGVLGREPSTGRAVAQGSSPALRIACPVCKAAVGNYCTKLQALTGARIRQTVAHKRRREQAARG